MRDPRWVRGQTGSFIVELFLLNNGRVEPILVISEWRGARSSPLRFFLSCMALGGDFITHDPRLFDVRGTFCRITENVYIGG